MPDLSEAGARALRAALPEAAGAILAVAAVARDVFDARCGAAWVWRGGSAVERADYAGGAAADWGLLLVVDPAALDGVSLPALVRRGAVRPLLLRDAVAIDAGGLGEVVECLGLVFPRH